MPDHKGLIFMFVPHKLRICCILLLRISGGDNRLKRLVELSFHPLESSKNSRLLTGLLRIKLGADLYSIMIIIGGGRGWARYPSPILLTVFHHLSAQVQEI